MVQGIKKPALLAAATIFAVLSLLVSMNLIGTQTVDLSPQRTAVLARPLTLTGPDKIAYLILWPHARPWCFSSPEPMLRAISEPQQVADALKTALAPFVKDAAEAASKSSQETEIAPHAEDKNELGQAATEAA